MFNVLIVDDEIWVCNLIRNIVDWNELGFNVINEAYDGLNALTIMERSKPELVVSDIRMPGFDGIHLIHEAAVRGLDSLFIFISGYNDFEYARDVFKEGAYDYLLKPIDGEELTKALKKAHAIIERRNATQLDQQEKSSMLLNSMNQLREHFVMNCVFSPINEETTYEDIEKKYGLRFKAEEYRILIIQICSIKGHSPDEYDFQETFCAIKMGIENTIDSCAYAVLCTSCKNRIIVVFNYETRNRDLIYNKLDEIRKKFRIDRYTQLVWGLGSVENTLPGLYHSYKSAVRSVRTHIIESGDKTFELSADRPETPILRELLPLDKEMKLTFCIESLDKEVFRKIISDLFGSCSKNVDAIFILVEEIAEVLYMTLRKKNMVVHVFDKDNFFSSIEMCNTLDEIIESFVEAFEKAVDFLDASRQNQNSRIIQVVKKYVYKHIAEDVNLQDAARKVYLNPSYLSELFKKEEGMNFSDYVINLKINMAKEMLINKKGRIEEIAELVGYKEAKYFGKVFKKIVGLTPSEFRKINT